MIIPGMFEWEVTMDVAVSFPRSAMEVCRMITTVSAPSATDALLIIETSRPAMLKDLLDEQGKFNSRFLAISGEVRHLGKVQSVAFIKIEYKGPVEGRRP